MCLSPTALSEIEPGEDSSQTRLLFEPVHVNKCIFPNVQVWVFIVTEIQGLSVVLALI